MSNIKQKRNISLRKINSVIVLFIFLSLICHATLSALCLLEWIEYTPLIIVFGVILSFFVVLHIIISLRLIVSDRHKQKDLNVYTEINNDTVVQAGSGFAIIILVLLHILTYIYLPAYYQVFSWNIAHLIIDTLLFLSLFVHLNLSIPRLLVSLGFLTGAHAYENNKKYVKIVLIIIIILLFLAEASYYIIK